MTFERVSEKRGAFGGITADGMINVLGRPPFTSLELVLREAAQNSWDARIRSTSRRIVLRPSFRVRIRTLTGDQETTFREAFSDPAKDTELAATNELRACLADRSPVRVLELCDFGTVGLSGPVSPSSPAAGGPDNFRNFFFDIGVEHVASGDGGTYGYGRSALYLASRARTILVDSLAETEAGAERRVLACRIGHAYERKGFGVAEATRFTGRHFWGRSSDDGGVRPVVGEGATELATALGLPTRSLNMTGTSILIPWPDVPADRIDGRWIWDAMLHHLWPKLVSQEGPLAMGLGVEEDGRELPAPSVHSHRTYGLFASALLAARNRSVDGGAKAIELQRPTVTTGHLGLEVGTAADCHRPADDDRELTGTEFDGGIQHVALMRPSELVVKYLEVPGARLDGRQWAGVFICVDDPKIRNVFAASEPPAHDDWIADRIDDKQERRIVRQTVKTYIPKVVREAFLMPAQMVGDGLEHGSLAAAADAFAQQFLSGGGTAPAVPPGKTRAGKGLLSAARVSGPTFLRLSLDGNTRVATYRVKVLGVTSPGVQLRASASVASEGGGGGDVPLGVAEPEVLGWLLESTGEQIIGVAARVIADEDLLLNVAFHGDYGIVATCEVEVEP